MSSQETKKQLQVGKTEIGNAEINYKGGKRTVQVFYGNYIQPKIDGKFVEISEKRYNSILESFLEQHTEYIYPSQQDKKDAIEKVKKVVSKLQSPSNMIDGDKKNIKNKNGLSVFFGEDTLEDSNANIQQNIKEDKTQTQKNEPVKSDPVVVKVNKNTSSEPKEEMIEVPREFYDTYLQVQEQLKEQEKKDKELSKLNNKIVELNKQIKAKDILLKREKIEKNKDFNEKLDDKLFSALIIICIIQSIVLAIIAFITLYL